MKKRLIVIAMAVILILSFVLTGCNMFQVNKERDANQVVASVKHNGLVSEITKQEFVSTFNSMFPTYHQYFNWSVDEAGENFLSMIARDKMTLVLAVEDLAGNNLDKGKFNAIVKANVSKSDETKGYGVYAAYLLSLLGADEQKYVREQTNKIFKDAYEEELNTLNENDRIKEEEENNDSDDSKAKEPRPVKDEKEDTTFKKDPSIDIDTANSVISFFEEYEKKISTSNEKDAYNKQKTNYLTNSYRTYDYYLAKQAESRITAKYEDKFEDLSDLSADVAEEFKNTLDEQKKNYKTASNYKSAIEGDGTVLFHNGRYVKLKSILLSFSDEQKAALDYIASAFGKESQKNYVTQLREALVFGLIEGYNDGLAIPSGVKNDLLGLKVYESNSDYDSTKPAGDPEKNYERDDNGDYKVDGSGNLIKIKPDSEMNYPYLVNPDYNPKDKNSDKWKTTPFLDVIARLGNDIKEARAAATEKYNNDYAEEIAKDPTSEAIEVGRKMFVNQKLIEKFEDWIYVVNDDPGMFEGKDYSETPMGTSSSYVTEFTALVRQLLADNIDAASGSVMINATNDQNVTGNIYKNIVKVDKLDSNLWKKEEVAIYTDTQNNISFVINEFGVHIVMLTDVPVDEQYNKKGVHYTVEENADFDMSAFAKYSNEEKEQIIDANSFFIFNENAYVDFDEETGKAITVAEKMEKSVKDIFDSTAYSNHTKKLFAMYGEKYFDSKDDKTASEGYADFKFEINLKKSLYNKILAPAKSQYKD